MTDSKRIKERERLRAERAAREKRERERAQRNRRLRFAGAVAAVLLLAIGGVVLVTGGVGGSDPPALPDTAAFSEATYTEAPAFQFTSDQVYTSGPFKDEPDYSLNIAPGENGMTAYLRVAAVVDCDTGRSLSSADVYEAPVRGETFSLNVRGERTRFKQGGNRQRGREDVTIDGRITPTGVTGTFEYTLRSDRGARCHLEEEFAVNADERPEGAPIQQGAPLAPASTTTSGGEVRDIECAGAEQLTSHLHVLLTVYVDGEQRQIPAGIGMNQPVAEKDEDGITFASGNEDHCLYWLHTHAADGILHVEAPSADRVYTLGDFFALWRQPLDTKRVASERGRVAALVDGKAWTGSPGDIPLRAAQRIQLNVRRDVPPNPIPVPDGLRGTT